MTPSEERAHRAGLGHGDLDDTDEDMTDAALLASVDASGGVFWHPARLQDVYDLPARVFRLYMAYRAGQAIAANKSIPKAEGSIGGVKVT